MFQSTHPHGVRPSSKHTRGCNGRVSIHAPTRGATVSFAVVPTPCGSFNPRTHTGCDELFVRLFKLNDSFNPRTHTGCDSLTLGLFKRVDCFNPRTHTGCDQAFAYRQT